MRVDQFDRRADHGLAGTLYIDARQVRTIELEAKQPDVARLVDALPHGGHDSRGLEQVGLHAPRHAQRLRAIGRLPHRHDSKGAILAHDVARVGHPRRRVQALIFHLDAERGDRTLAGVAHDLSIANHDGDRGVAQRRGIEDRPLLARTSRQVAARQKPGKIQREHRHVRHVALFSPCAAARRDADDQPRPTAAIGHRIDAPSHDDGAGARIE